LPGENALAYFPAASASKKNKSFIKLISGELPNRRYLIGAVHLDWVVINGRPEVFELSVYVTDMTSLDLYIVTDALQKHQVTPPINFQKRIVVRLPKEKLKEP